MINRNSKKSLNVFESNNENMTRKKKLRNERKNGSRKNRTDRRTEFPCLNGVRRREREIKAKKRKQK